MLALNAAINPVINSNIGNPPGRPRHRHRLKARRFRMVSCRPGNGFVAQSSGWVRWLPSTKFQASATMILGTAQRIQTAPMLTSEHTGSRPQRLGQIEKKRPRCTKRGGRSHERAVNSGNDASSNPFLGEWHVPVMAGQWARNGPELRISGSKSTSLARLEITPQRSSWHRTALMDRP